MISGMENEIVFGYGCIVDPNLRAKGENTIKNSKIYDRILREIRERFIPEENIFIDIITGSYRKRKYLIEIVDTFRNGSNWYNSPCGTIYIPTIAELGTTNREISKNYTMLCDNNIGILVGDNDALCTVNYGFEYCKSSEEISDIINSLYSVKIPNKQGRKALPRVITLEFKETYWMYENYFLSEAITLDNPVSGHIPKKKFYELSKIYEASEYYSKDEENEINKNPELLEKPKRHGVLPKDFEALMELYEQNGDIKQSCTLLNIPPMSKNTFTRYLHKYYKGRKGMRAASAKYGQEYREKEKSSKK